MIRELQKLVTDERGGKEKLETELLSAKDSLKALQLAGTYNAEYEKRVRDLVSINEALYTLGPSLEFEEHGCKFELQSLKSALK